MNIDHLLWCEKYRPQTIGECILPDRLKNPFLEYVRSHSIPNLILAGGAGVGKTTVAKAMCQEIGCDYLIINGSDESGIDTFRTKIKGYASSMSLTGGRKVIIIDEADYLNANSTQPALRSAIEEYAKNCSFIFTCNFVDRLIKPLQSRCAVIDFTLQPSEKPAMAVTFLGKLEGILNKETIPYEKRVLIELIKKFFPDFRRVINELQRYSQFKEINVGILTQLHDTVLLELAAKLKEKDFTYCRKWVATQDVDPATLYRKLYESLTTLIKPESLPQAIVTLAEYQYKGAFVADQEINLMAMLTELMVNCDWI